MRERARSPRVMDHAHLVKIGVPVITISVSALSRRPASCNYAPAAAAPEQHPPPAPAVKGARDGHASAEPMLPKAKGGKRQELAAAPAEALLSGLVDIDANFLHEDLEPDTDYHIQQARVVGVASFVTPVVNLDCLEPAFALAAARPEVYVTAGVHPFWTAAVVGGAHRDGGVDFSEEALARLRHFAARSDACCIGECGLDFCRGPTEANGFPSPEAQLPWCEAQVALACELRKPLFLHIRDAFAPFLEIVARQSGRLPPAVVHAFTGTEEELQAYVGMGFFIGVTGYICQATQPLRKLLKEHVPLERLMVETDAPYMGFKNCRRGESDKRQSKYPNVPAALPRVVEAVAECYGVTPHEVAAQTTANARRFFGMA